MRIKEKDDGTMNDAIASTGYAYTSAPTARRMSWREAFLLATYHTRLLNWWLFLLMMLGFAGAGALLWLEVRAGTPDAFGHGDELSRFVLESGAGLVAAMLTSFLVVGDSALEVTMATRSGIYRVLVWRYLLTLFFLAICSAAYLAWSLLRGVQFSPQQTPLFLLLLWLAPVLVMSMLGMLGALTTRNAALGAVIAAIPLMAALFLHNDLLPIPAVRPFFIPYTIWAYASPTWWSNRASLLAVAVILALCNWRLLQREERLLGNLH
jgi:hypothetical protein